MAEEFTFETKTGYLLGLLSIILAFISSKIFFTGVVVGILGIITIRKQKTSLAKKARILNILGIIFNVISGVLLLFKIIQTGSALI